MADHLTETIAAKGEVTVQELSRAQQALARRLASSRATVPDFTLQAEVDMERCAELQAAAADVVIKACAIALREHPRANGAYKDGQFELYSRVNVGIVVATSDALAIPTIFDADAKSLTEIAAERLALGERARAGTITPPELAGGTFTVSDLGSFGVERFSPVINPPQAAALAVGTIVERAAVRDGRIVARRLMNVTLACDLRILYGAEAARFLARIRELLEEPQPMLP
jgi:pyruvate dehydrogenase E2 component (dihydrolipoamide acetyltransferase)